MKVPGTAMDVAVDIEGSVDVGELMDVEGLMEGGGLLDVEGLMDE